MNPICSEPGCTASHLAHGLCSRHYQAKRRAAGLVATRTKPIPEELRVRRPAGGRCEYPHCDRTASCKGLCAKHYQRARRHGPDMPTSRLRYSAPAKPCSTPTCERTADTGGKCLRCHTNFLRAQNSLIHSSLPECYRSV